MQSIELIYFLGHDSPELLVAIRPYTFVSIWYLFPLVPIPFFHSPRIPTGSHSNRLNMSPVVCTCSCEMGLVLCPRM